VTPLVALVDAWVASTKRCNGARAFGACESAHSQSYGRD